MNSHKSYQALSSFSFQCTSENPRAFFTTLESTSFIAHVSRRYVYILERTTVTANTETYNLRHILYFRFISVILFMSLRAKQLYCVPEFALEM